MADLKAKLEARRAAFAPPQSFPRPAAREGLSAAEVLDYLGRVVEATLVDARYVAWSIVAPLDLYWKAVALLSSRQERNGRVGVYFIEEICKWLGEVPIPLRSAEMTEAELEEDLERLQGSLFSIPSVRRRFAARFFGECTRRPSDRLVKALDKLGYLAEDGLG
jgi:hypothetical protein